MDINSPSHPRFEPVTVMLNEQQYLAGEREAEMEELRRDPEFLEWLDMLDAQAEQERQ